MNKYQFETATGRLFEVSILWVWASPVERAIKKARRIDKNVARGRFLGAYGWCGWFDACERNH